MGQLVDFLDRARCSDSARCREPIVYTNGVAYCTRCGLWAGARTRKGEPVSPRISRVTDGLHGQPDAHGGLE